MSSALQNRLVGTIILVALAVIFLPDVLDGRKESNKEMFVEANKRPDMKPVTNADDFPAEEVQRNASREVEILDEPVVDDVQAPAQNTDAEAVDEQGDDRSLRQNTVVKSNDDRLLEQAGWVVQLGVFRHEKNVQELLDKLKAEGYRAFSRPVQTSTGELTKVFVGPDLEKEKLESAVPHLKELTNLQGRITPFTVK